MFKLIQVLILAAVCYGNVIDIGNVINFIHDKYQKELETDAASQMDMVQESVINSRNLELCNFYLYRQSSPHMPENVLGNEASVLAASFSDQLKTVILIHGHGGTAFTSLNPVIKNAIFMVEDVNLVVVDWSIYASLSYSAAVGTVNDVAGNVANFISALVATTTNATTLEQIHMVGFNLGAHVAGIASRSLGGVARITGLDPAGSQWESNSNRLSRTDARYVEVIHTDGSGLFSNGIGTALGHVDFFANGGSYQPGCLTHSCSHERAFELFAASMINENLSGKLCSSNLLMSLNLCKGQSLRMGNNELVKHGNGMYRVNTRTFFPF